MINTNEFSNILKDMGYKLTEPRKVVFDVLSQSRMTHMNASDVFKRAKEIKPDIGAATVYRVLALFEKLDLVYSLDLDDGCSRYELRRSFDGHRHHHLICESCGKVMELKEDLLEKLEIEIEKTKGFVVKDHRVKIYGTCKKCRKNPGML